MRVQVSANHLEALPPCLADLPSLTHLGVALNYIKAPFPLAALAGTLVNLDISHMLTALSAPARAALLAAVGQLGSLTALHASCNNLQVT